MKIEIEFSPAEAELLKIAYNQLSHNLAELWDVQDMAGFVALMTMHGVDELERL